LPESKDVSGQPGQGVQLARLKHLQILGGHSNLTIGTLADIAFELGLRSGQLGRPVKSALPDESVNCLEGGQAG
jgi:hypothetical protein